MTRDELKALIAQEVRRAMSEPPGRAAPADPVAAAPRTRNAKDAEPPRARPPQEFPPHTPLPPRWMRAGPRPELRLARQDDEHDDAAWGLRDLPPPQEDAALHVERPRDPALLAKYARSTPSRIGVGRTGTRYLTDVYIHLRAEHAVAKDAVESELPADFAARLGALELRTSCVDRDDYLLYPEHGRRLTDESAARLAAEGSRGVDVQVIVGDGLSAVAALANAPALLPALQAGLAQAGFKTGRPLVVRFARVGVQDEIGVLLGARATVLLVGERPGLGTGDSLSIYIAYAPETAQDNAEKNCISNVRPRGIQVDEAVRQTVGICKRAFELGRGGVTAQQAGPGA